MSGSPSFANRTQSPNFYAFFPRRSSGVGRWVTVNFPNLRRSRRWFHRVLVRSGSAVTYGSKNHSFLGWWYACANTYIGHRVSSA